MSIHPILSATERLTQRYEYGDTEIRTTREASERIQAVFGRYAQPGPHTVFLLVHNVESAMAVLTFLGVDVSKWEFNLKSFLRTVIYPIFRS